MAFLATRKGSFRARGIARRKQLLASARELLNSRSLDEITLGDVAKHAKVAKGSAYHFYSDIKDVYVHLVDVLDEELRAEIQAPIRKVVREWRDVMDILLERAVKFYVRNPSARQLLIGPTTPPDVKMRDRDSDVVIGKMFEDHVATFFELPTVPRRSEIFFWSVEIADLMLSLSMLRHGAITDEMNREAKHAAVAYLASYIPSTLPRRQRRIARTPVSK